MWVCFALVVAGAALAAYFFIYLPSATHDAQGGLKTDPRVQVGSLSGNGNDLAAVIDESTISFSINTTPTFASGSAPGNLTIENLKGARNRFTVAIALKDDGKTVYESGAIDPGTYIESAPLLTSLPKGDYPATALFKTYRLTDDTRLGQVAAELVLHIES